MKIIDIHGHLGNINFVPFWAADADKLAAYCRESGVDRLCLSASRSIMYDIREGNAELDAALKSHDEFYGYVVVSPTFPESLKDLSYLKTNRKFRGVKIHPDYHGYDLSVPSNFKFVDALLKKTPMALFHTSCMPGTGFSPFATIAELARRNPKTKIVAAHGAGLFQNGNYPFFPNLDSLERVAEGGLPKNLWVDTAHYLLYAYPTILQKMVDLAGADHVVFGTDAPLQGPMQMRFMAELVESLDVSKADKEKIFFRNAEKILGLKKDR
jgi:predicted TIM-barrel fold metal-dependent hydrolase